MIPQKMLATKDGIQLHLRFTWNIGATWPNGDQVLLIVLKVGF